MGLDPATSTPAEKLRAEAMATCARLGDAGRQLLRWASLLDADRFPLVPPADIRALAHALAHQGGRLDMAASMVVKPPRRRKK